MNFEMKELPRQQSDRVRDQRIERVVELVSPAEILEDLPLGPKREDAVLGHRAEVKVGPRPRGRPPAGRGRAVQRARSRGRDATTRSGSARRADDLRDDLCIAMRIYFEKPRTTTGWKGLINDPHLDDSRDVNFGLHTARRLLLEVHGSRPGRRLRVPRPDHAAVHLRRGLLGRDRRSHHREPDASPARRRGSRCRSASRTAPPAASSSPSTRFAPLPVRTPSPASTSAAPRRSSTRRAIPTAT